MEGVSGLTHRRKPHPGKSATKISWTAHKFDPRTAHPNELTVQLDMLYLDSLGTPRIRAHEVQG